MTGRCVRCGAGTPGRSAQPEAISRETTGPASPGVAGAGAAKAEVAAGGAPEGKVVAGAGEALVRGAIPDVGGAPAEAGGRRAAPSQSQLTKHRPMAGREDEETLRHMLGARLLRPNHLNSPLRLLIWLALTQIVLVAILMATRKVPQPEVDSSVLDPAGGTYAVSLAVFVVMTASVAAGYWFGLAGALRVRTSVGVPVAALATWTLADYPITALRAGSTGAGHYYSGAGLLWAQLGVLAVFWAWLACVAVARRRARATGPAAQTDPDGMPWQTRVFLGAGACVLAYFALELAIWVQYLRAGQAAEGTGFLLKGLGVQSILLPTFLILVLLLGSTDLLEWGEVAVRRVAVRAGKPQPPWLLMIATPLAAVAILASVIRMDGSNVLPELAVIGIPAMLIAVLVWLAPGYGSWSADIRSRAVTTGAVVIFAYSTILLSITSAVLHALGWPSLFGGRFYSLVSTPIALAALTAGVLVLARGVLEPEQRGRGLLLVVAAVVIITAGLPAFLFAVRLPAAFPARHFSLLNGLLFAAAAGTLIVIIRLAVLGRLSVAGGLLANALGLLLGLQLVRWLLDLLQAIATLGADSDYLLAGLFLVTVLWGLAISGDKLTGTKANSAKYPRDGRILLTVSYTLISSATLLYLGALHGPPRAPAPPSYLTGDPFTPLGLSVLGSALVIVAFVVRLAQAPARATGAGKKPASRAGERAGRFRDRAPSARAVQFGILAAGAALTAAALAVVATRGLPDVARASAAQLERTYRAQVPGPDCDTGGAAWSVAPGEPISARCGGTGLVVTAASHGSGDVTFQPPIGFTSPDYRVSITVTFGAGLDGCAGIYTRASATGRYESYLCSHDSAGILAVSTQRAAQLATGFARPSPSYTLVTVSDGTSQRLLVNGSQIDAVVNKEFPVTNYVGLALVNLGDNAGSATFSHFAFTPLPESRRM